MSTIILAALMVLLPVTGFAQSNEAPHQGALVSFSDDTHLEFVLEDKTGRFIFYFLDSANQPVPLEQSEIEITIVSLPPLRGKVHHFELKRQPADRSHFMVEHDIFKVLVVFNVYVKSLTINGKEFKDIKFNVPDGDIVEIKDEDLK